MLLAIFLAGAILWNLPWSKYDNVLFVSAVEPGYLDFDNLPDTNFSCESKVIGGYYADIETGCQMFHVCTIGQKSEITDIKFLCLNGTVFDQETRVCERLDEVDCSRSESFFDLNLELYGNNGGGYGIQPEDDGKDAEQERCDADDYEDGDTSNSCKNQSPTNGTEHKETEYPDWEESTSAHPAPQLSSTSSTTTTTTARPTAAPSSSARPPSTVSPTKFLFPHTSTTAADPGLQLLALHESFQENIKQHDAQAKLRPINVPAAAKANASAFSFSKMPAQHSYPSTFPAAAANVAPSPNHSPPLHHVPAPSSKLSPPFYPIPTKLPNTLSNLSQNRNTFAASPAAANSHRTAPSSSSSPFAASAFKTVPDPPPAAGYFSGGGSGNNHKQHSQKVSLGSPPTPAGVSVQRPQQPHANESPVLFAYKILNSDANRPDRFRGSSPNAFQYNFPTNPLAASGGAVPSPFKAASSASAGGGRFATAAKPTFAAAVAQNHAYTFRPQRPQPAAAPSLHHYLPQQRHTDDDESVDDGGGGDDDDQRIREEDDMAEEADDAQDAGVSGQSLRERSAVPQQPKSHGYESHTNFARAIADRPAKNGLESGSEAAAVSVVLSTSSVSSSISSNKPQSAISNSTHPISSSNMLQRSRGAPLFTSTERPGRVVAGPPASGKNVGTTFVGGSTLKSILATSVRPNISEINESLTEEPYYEEGEEEANIEYDENSAEYKELAYPSDVRKIRQR